MTYIFYYTVSLKYHVIKLKKRTAAVERCVKKIYESVRQYLYFQSFFYIPTRVYIHPCIITAMDY